MTIFRIIDGLLSPFLDFLFPPVCILCDGRTEGGSLCKGCLKKLQCAARVIEEGRPEDFSHLEGPLHFEKVFTCWPYSPEMEKIIHWIKYSSGTRLGIFMGNMAGTFLHGRIPAGKGVSLIPVPLHPLRKRERGYNQSMVLASGLSKALSIGIERGVLRRVRNTPSQTFLTAQERQKNVGRAFGIRRPGAICKKICVLVDDVCTTGATMNACAAALKEAGAPVVLGVALVRPQFEASALRKSR